MRVKGKKNIPLERGKEKGEDKENVFKRGARGERERGTKSSETFVIVAKKELEPELTT